jgi:tetratricopeptide (TPR) repeat protein
MRDACLTPDQIADLVRGIAREEDERHITGCATCRRRVMLVQNVAAAGLEHIADTAAEVHDLVESLLAVPRTNWWKTVREPEYRRTDVARRLLTLAIEARWTDRSHSAALVKTAGTIIEAAGSGDENELRFEIWKWAATILRESGRYAELLEAFTKVEEAARHTANREAAEATVALSRALFYAEPDIWKPEEAAALLDGAERVFAECDQGRMFALRTARAILLFRSGNLSGAAEVFAMLVEATSGNRDHAHLDALINWLAVRVELREADSNVEEMLGYVLEQNQRSGRTVQVGRANWLLGRLHAIRGDSARAVALFKAAVDQIEDSDAALRIGLDTVEVLLSADGHRDAYTLARELASAAAALDQREPTRRHNLTAQVFAYLREAAQHQALTADLATECGRYLDRIMRQRAVEFVPPMPLIEM